MDQRYVIGNFGKMFENFLEIGKFCEKMSEIIVNFFKTLRKFYENSGKNWSNLGKVNEIKKKHDYLNYL